jgi:hypothetical protein
MACTGKTLPLLYPFQHVRWIPSSYQKLWDYHNYEIGFVATLRKLFRKVEKQIMCYVYCLLTEQSYKAYKWLRSRTCNLQVTLFTFSSAIVKTFAKKGVGLKVGFARTQAHYTQHTTSLHLTQHEDYIFWNQNFLTIRQHTFVKQENFEQTIHQSVLAGEGGACGVRKTSFERQEGKLLSSWPKSACAVNFANMM